MAPPLSDKVLRARVKLLGNLLGNVLRTQAGKRVLTSVETLRKGYIRLRRQDSDRLRERLLRVISLLDPESLTHVVRAFSIYFSLVNIAEEEFQHRLRRRQLRSGGPLWTGSFDATLREFQAQGITAKLLQTLLDGLTYMPVITAHPTESKRRTVMLALRRIFLTCQQLDDPRLNRYDREEIEQQLESQIRILWNTDEVRVARPKVIDEIKHGLFFFNESLFQAVPTTYRNLEKAVQRIYGKKRGGTTLKVPSFLRFGSWIGGDRDGNPNVKPETTELAVHLQHRQVLLEYLRRLNSLLHLLTHSIRLSQPAPALLASLERDETYADQAFAQRPTQYAHEPYRRKLAIMHYRLGLNLDTVKKRLDGQDASVPADAYGNEAEFLADLRLIYDSLVEHGEEVIANGELKDLIRLVESFGFFLMHLDVRQESGRHTEAVAEILAALGQPDYRALDEDGRLTLLGRLVAEAPPPQLDAANLSPATQETLAVLRVMARLRHEVSAEAFGSYVISMTHSASHVMEVMYLAHLAGLAGRNSAGDWFCDLRISPLFETVVDLEHIEPVMSQLLDDPCYGALLKASGNLQEVMLGYSDSCKDGGIVASHWCLYQAQQKITALTAARNIECRLFHGRGGTVGRGGGPTHESILSQPPGTVHGRIKFTEQGEVLSFKYSNMETAVYELTMGLSGLIKASRSLIRAPRKDSTGHLDIMAELAEIGEDAYRDLTDRQPGFLDYFYEATPVSEIGLLNIGSRPSHRNRGDRSKSSVRAIAWVFGWAQSRHTLPAWYGIGAALKRWSEGDPRRLERLRDMYGEWPFFRALLSNTQMALFKADMEIAQEYAGLCHNQESAAQVYGKIHDEFNRTLEQVLQVADAKTLLEDNPPLALSLGRRNPYLDPLNHIQITLLRRYRDLDLPETEREVWLNPLLRSINAVAAGMRNTG